MAEIKHEKYGRIIIRRNSHSRYVRLSVAPSGNLQISAPMYTPLYFIKQFLKKSDSQIAEMFAHHTTRYATAMRIGKSHRLEIASSGNDTTSVSYKKPVITVSLAKNDDIADDHIQQQIRILVAKALRLEAKAYLPRRAEHLSGLLGLEYERLRFSHAKSRWGSCSSDRTLSLNIALMKLDFELIDYVIVHELSHLAEMNHSSRFWELVASHSPHYKVHRKELKRHSPHI